APGDDGWTARRRGPRPRRPRAGASRAVDLLPQCPGLDGAAGVPGGGGQAGIVCGGGPLTGLGGAAQPREGVGEGQVDGAGVRETLVSGQAAVQLVGGPRLGEGVVVAALAVEAACQAED